jgi:WhiB family redox-sensing transcriptional regulator
MPDWQMHTPTSRKEALIMELETDWMLDAACEGKDPELFFPLGEDGPVNEDQIKAAKAVCFACPVAASCLDWAFTSRSDHGIYGGLTGEERRLIRAQWLAFQRSVDQTAIAV